MAINPEQRAAFKAIDADLREGYRANIEAGKIIQKLNAYALNPVAAPLSCQQIKVMFGLLEFILPKLKAVEHIHTPDRPPTREELIEQLAQLHAGAVAVAQRRPAAAAPDAEPAAEVRH